MSKSETTGWVIEHRNSEVSKPYYFAGPGKWSYNHLDAVRFARKEDADKFNTDGDRVAAHAWY